MCLCYFGRGDSKCVSCKNVQNPFYMHFVHFVSKRTHIGHSCFGLFWREYQYELLAGGSSGRQSEARCLLQRLGDDCSRQMRSASHLVESGLYLLWHQLQLYMTQCGPERAHGVPGEARRGGMRDMRDAASPRYRAPLSDFLP